MPDRPSYYLGKMDELRSQRGNTCAIDPTRATCSPCLDFAHLVPTELGGRGRGRADRYHEIKKHPHLFVLMCKRHHRRRDRAFWEWLDAERRRILEPDSEVPF